MSERNFPNGSQRDWVIMAALGGLAIALRLLPGARLIDDAYITYRYAKNILDGAGFVYNPGEAVLGTTTPLYTLLLVMIGFVTRSDAFPLISPLVNALADGLGTPLLYVIGRRMLNHRLPASILGFLWAISPRSVTFAIGGMETSVYITLMLATFVSYLERRYRLAALLAALSTLTRPDALIWIGPLGLAIMIDLWYSRQTQPPAKRLPWLEGLIYVAVLAPWVIFASITFGNPLPHSIAAKSVAYHLPPTQGLVAFMQQYAIPFEEFSAFGQTGALIGFIVYLPLTALGSLYLYHADRRFLPILIFPWTYALVFIVANPLIFRWYTAPPIVIYTLLIIAGVWGLVGRIASVRGACWALAATGIVWTALSLNEWKIHPDHGLDRPAPDMAWYQLELLYQQAAISLRPLVKKNTVIAAGDIGALGWYSGARILDTLGLISPQATRYYPLDPSMLATAPYAVAPDLIIEQKPDYIVILETYGRNSLMKDPRFVKMYRLRETINTDIYESRGMLIFERADLSGGD